MSAKQKDVGSSLALDQNFLCMLFRLCETFSANFFNVSKGSPFNFLYFATEWMHFSVLCDLPETSNKIRKTFLLIREL